MQHSEASRASLSEVKQAEVSKIHLATCSLHKNTNTNKGVMKGIVRAY